MIMNRIDWDAIMSVAIIRAAFENSRQIVLRTISVFILSGVTGVFAPAAWGSLSSVVKSFSPSSIAIGVPSTLTITIKHGPPGNSDKIAFTDTYPANLKNAATPNVKNTCGGTVTAVAGGSSLSLSGVKLAGNNSCTVSVSVTSVVAGSYLNSTGIVTSDSKSIGPATAILTVVASPPVTAPSGFNAFEAGTAAGSVSGVIKTKIAAGAFGLDVVAVNGGATAVDTTFAGGVRLELVDASAGANCGTYGLIQNLGTLTFTAADLGRKTLAGISEPDAWPNARIRMRYPATGAPTITACSTDNFAIRPASFGGVTASDASSATAGTTRALTNVAVAGGNVHKAGRPFSIAATARNAVGGTTSNYAGSPAASLTACLLPAAGCTLGALSTVTWTAVSGTVTTSNASYSEVGAFAMKLADASFAAVDAADGSTAAERTIESAAVNVGRFVPDHFDLTTASTPVFKTFNDTTCAVRSFTYAGQPFGYLTLPQATITAKNAAGVTTLNYSGALWKLTPAGAVQSHTPVTGNLDIGLLGAPTVTESGGGMGTLIANADDEIAFVRTVPVAPFLADISLTMSIQDIAEAGVSGNGTVDTLVSALFASIAFDVSNQIRFGQLILSNAHGSELLGLPVPIETRYWNGSGFALNADDHCTQLAAANVVLSNWQRDLNACNTSVTLFGRFNAGRGNLRLSAPGTGNTGSVDLALQLGAVAGGSTCVGGAAAASAGALKSWLQGRWSGPDYDDNPSARASFGLHRGSKPLIYLREMY